MTDGNDIRLEPNGPGGPPEDPLPEDRPGHPILAEEEAAEAPWHGGEPAQPAGYVQEDYDPIPEPPGAVEVDPDGPG
jgi:hypothetical protein